MKTWFCAIEEYSELSIADGNHKSLEIRTVHEANFTDVNFSKASVTAQTIADRLGGEIIKLDEVDLNPEEQPEEE